MKEKKVAEKIILDSNYYNQIQTLIYNHNYYYDSYCKSNIFITK